MPGWKAIEGVEVVAVADVNPAAAANLAKEYSVSQVFSNYEDLVKEDLDAVDICTPNRVHTPAVMAALKAGKHVYCEKPLAVTTAEVRQMGQFADKKRLKLMTGQHQRYTSDGQAAKAWAASGNLGFVYHARVRAMRRAWLPVSPGFIDKRLSGGGPCMDIGVHALDFCMSLMDFPTPQRVSGCAKTIFAKGHSMPNEWGEWDRKLFSVEDFAAGFIHFKGGATMTLESSWLGHQRETEDMSCQVFGMKGGLSWPSGEFATVQGGKLVNGSLKNPRRVDKPHGEAIRAFYDCVTQNKPSPIPWTQSLKVIAILEAVYEAQKKGKEIKVTL
jgi:predicted dehydrogenase